MREAEDIRVTIEDVVYMPSLEAPKDKPHPFVYFLTIFNGGTARVRIEGRKWVVREGDDCVVVEGEGVVGQKPDLAPGEQFSYNSYHVVATDARVEGAFFGRTEAGDWVFTRIPEFRLAVPG
jgi:ApaG protein